MSNDRDDDNPIGWNSIYPNDRDSSEEEEQKGQPEEERQTKAAELGEGREASLSEPAKQSAAAAQPDVGYPRDFPSALEEGKPRRRQQPIADPSEEEEEKTPSPVRYRRKKGHPVLWSFFIALGLVIIAAGSVLFYVWNGLRPAPASTEPVRVTIAKGMGAKSIAEELEQSGLIRNAFLFSAWLKYKNEGAGFQAGDYDMMPGLTLEEIVAKLNAGDTIAAETVKFTIPEGFTVEQIADRLVKEAGINKDKFLQEMKDPNVLGASMWTKEIPENASLKYPLEGYLFPETYEMKKGSSEEDIIDRMVAELDRKLGQLPEDWQTTMEERGLNLHQLLTIASLVEREVMLDDERAKVASVIENRLEKEMPLQIDATIQYALGKQKEKLSTDDLKIDSPYNTYLNQGLPPGPIASPSLKSIEAALYPEDTDYLYYVTKKDGSNQHLFATTYKQHQKNIETSEKNAKQ